MHEFKIVGQEFRDGTAADGSAVMRTYYTFHVSDDAGKTWVPSLFWQPECQTEGLPKTYYIERTISRLKQGQSRAAFGEQFLVLQDGKPVGYTKPRPGTAPGRAAVMREDGAPEVETVAVHGGGTKPREKRAKWKATLDGKTVVCSAGKPLLFPDERSARAAVAVHAFCTSGKAGRIDYALARLKEEVPGGKEYRVWACCKENSVRAKVDGVEYGIRWFKEDGVYMIDGFKPLPIK